MRRLASVLSLCALAALAGCHSHYIQATITNASGSEIDVVQVDYPSASFGVQALAPGQVFRYRFKLLGSGPVKISFTDAHKGEHQVTGPSFDEGSQGTLDIVFPAQDRAEFHVSVHP